MSLCLPFYSLQGEPFTLADRSDQQLQKPPTRLAVVQFARFDCPESAQVASSLKQLLQHGGFDLRVVFKHLPANSEGLQIHEAALAAGQQGKFWQMHDQLFERPDSNYAGLLNFARELGLDVQKFQTALDEREFRHQVLDDLTEARGLGVTKTPTLFVNGRRLEGIEEVQAFVSGVLNPPQPEPDPEKIYEFDLSDSPSRGPENAPITIVEISDFRCGFCGPNSRNLSKIEAAFPGKIRRVFKHYPTKLDEAGALPHLGAVAAERQGKFWEMRETLMARPLENRVDLLARADAIGLDLDRFQEDLPKVRKAIERDVLVGRKIGIRKTPTTFINGKPLGGRQSFRTLQRKVNQILGNTPSEVMPVVEIPAYGSDVPYVAIDFYCDYSRPESHQLHKVLNAFLKTRDDVQVIFHPYTTSKRSSVMSLNEIAFVAASQKKFPEWHRLALSSPEPASQTSIKELLEKIGIDLDQTTDDLADQVHRSLLTANAEEALAIGLTGESALIVNGSRLNGIPEVKELIARAKEACCGQGQIEATTNR